MSVPTATFAIFWSQIKQSNFHPLEVVGRGSETQLQVGENFNKISRWLKGQVTLHILVTLQRQKAVTAYLNSK